MNDQTPWISAEPGKPTLGGVNWGGLKTLYIKEIRRFFKVHESADVEHSQVCRELLDRLPEGERIEAVEAGEELAGALWNFLSGVEARAALQ